MLIVPMFFCRVNMISRNTKTNNRSRLIKE